MRQNSPHVLVVAAAVLLFLCMPDGILFIYAACSSPGATGSVYPFGVNHCQPCETEGGGPGLIYEAENCTVSVHGTRCEMTATVDLSIHETGCKVYWKTFCTGGLCASLLAGTGIMSGSRSMTVLCNGSGDTMAISLGYPDGCSSCIPAQCFVATGTCTAS